ncbi:hypothetical protein SeLEV6574_g04514 [Synchytrium endobioticum]|nr:hypothetical protein SeLEV6574_g04514 [Synchytrium endobioticum]
MAIRRWSWHPGIDAGDTKSWKLSFTILTLLSTISTAAQVIDHSIIMDTPPSYRREVYHFDQLSDEIGTAPVDIPTNNTVDASNNVGAVAGQTPPSSTSLTRQYGYHTLRHDSVVSSSSHAPSYASNGHDSTSRLLRNPGDRKLSVTSTSSSIWQSSETDVDDCIVEEHTGVPVSRNIMEKKGPDGAIEFVPLKVKGGNVVKGEADSEEAAADKSGGGGETTLKPTMGWISGANLVVGLMIGSGIFAVSGKVLGYVGSPGMALVIWLIGGLAAFAGTFSYIELGCMLPQSGGEQAYLDAQYQKPRALVAFLFCWCMILAIRPGSEAVDSNIFGQYILYPIYGSTEAIPRWPKTGLAVACVTSLTILNICSAKWAIRVHDWLTFVKLGTVIAISVTGLVVATGVTHVPIATSNFSAPFAGTSSSASGYALALFKIFWSYEGWNNLNYSLGELKDPVKNLPKAATVGVSLVTFFYLTANVSYLVVLPTSELLAAKELVAAVFFKKVMGSIVGGVICPLLVALSAYGAVAAMMFSVSRVIQAGSVAGVLPFSNLLKRLHPKTGTPVNALLLNWCVAMLYIVAPPPGAAYNFLVDVVGYPTWVFYGLSVIGLFSLRRTRPDLKRPFKVWPPFAIFFILIAVYLSIFPWIPVEEPYPYFLPPLLSVLLTLSGVPVWFSIVKNIPKTGMDFAMHH